MRNHLTLPILSFILIGSISMSAQCPTIDTLFVNDFEVTNGGLVPGGGGDWEWGNIPTMLANLNCTGAYVDPPGPFSGVKGWGNNVADCYGNLGTASSLSMTLDLSSPTYLAAEISWAQWYDVFVAFDYIYITANGTDIYRNDTNQTATTWENMSADLTPFLGLPSVVISFELFATAVVNRAGWYLDDILVTACADPSLNVSDGLISNNVFRVWPNPTTDHLQVNMTGLDVVQNLQIFSSSGQLVKEITWQRGAVSRSIDLRDLPPSVYSIVANGTKSRTVEQLVIQ